MVSSKLTVGEVTERLTYQLGGIFGAVLICYVISIIAGRRGTGLRKCTMKLSLQGANR
jgi:hypothetical protein